jgi:hypothetical protein
MDAALRGGRRERHDAEAETEGREEDGDVASAFVEQGQGAGLGRVGDEVRQLLEQ